MNSIKLIILLLATFGLASIFQPILSAACSLGWWIFIPLTLAALAAVLFTGFRLLQLYRSIKHDVVDV